MTSAIQVKDPVQALSIFKKLYRSFVLDEATKELSLVQRAEVYKFCSMIQSGLEAQIIHKQMFIPVTLKKKKECQQVK